MFTYKFPKLKVINKNVQSRDNRQAGTVLLLIQRADTTEESEYTSHLPAFTMLQKMNRAINQIASNQSRY